MGLAILLGRREGKAAFGRDVAVSPFPKYGHGYTGLLSPACFCLIFSGRHVSKPNYDSKVGCCLPFFWFMLAGVGGTGTCDLLPV